MTDRRIRVPGWIALAALLGFAAACGSGAKTEAGERPESPAGEAKEAEAAAPGRVTLTEAAFRTAGIQVEPVGQQGATAAGAGLQVPGQVEFDPARVAIISPRIGGRIERLTVVEGDRVGAGQTVAYITSPAHLTAQNDLIQSVRRAQLLAGTPDAAGADALVAAARRRLRLLGVSEGEISRIASSGEVRSVLAVPAPFAGSIVEAQALAGAAVEAGTPLFKIADLSVVDVVAEVPERALPLLRVGERASISLAAYPSLRFDGRVERLRDQLDPTTRTVKAIIHVPNPDRALRPGMFATVTLAAPGGSAPATVATVLTVPESALVTDGSERYVFVEVGPRTFERRSVAVESLAAPGSAVASGRVAVRSGLSAGERVVVAGAFTLKSELAKAAFAEDE
jgi:RND family efflux transporter MFP subunit